MKTCPRCGEEKELSAFCRNKAKPDGLSTQCRPCKARTQKAWYETHAAVHKKNVKENTARIRDELAEWVVAYLKEHSCVDCGEADPIVLEFDHVRGEKLFDVSAAGSKGLRLPAVQLEVEKCDVRCANCHRRKTARSANTRRARILGG